MWNKTEQRMKPLIRFVILFSILLTGCNRHAGDIRLEQALTFAGENRSELEKVLDRYASDSADSLKYRAARFLIENMPGYHYYEGEELDKHAIYFYVLGKSKKQPGLILDSLNSISGRYYRFRDVTRLYSNKLPGDGAYPLRAALPQAAQKQDRLPVRIFLDEVGVLGLDGTGQSREDRFPRPEYGRYCILRRGIFSSLQTRLK